MGQLVRRDWSSLLSHHLPLGQRSIRVGLCLLPILCLVPGLQVLQWCGVSSEVYVLHVSTSFVIANHFSLYTK